ncbi:MAG: helix-turn-helix domain-containing protein, partial [Clostridia bacterium]
LPVLTEALSLLLQALHQLPGKAPFAIGVGYRHEGLMEAHLSYREAYTAYNDAVMWKSEQVIFGVDSGTEALPYTLSYDALEKLYNLLLKGESEQAAEHLDKLVAENFAPDSPSRHNRVICHQFYRDVYGVLVRLSSQQDLLPIVDAISSEVSGQPFERKIAQLRTAFFDIANIVMSKKQATAFELVQDMQAYIMSHASDPSVSLTAVADQFGMSESNMSKFFKSKMGVNFSAYLENLRLGAAEQLLMQTNQSVRSVAEAVGYVTPATFYKAFKRKHGITPSEWVMQIKDI